MVFFDWDRSNLSQQALNTIKQAADAFKTKGSARITATGHTDTSGPESLQHGAVAASRQCGQGCAGARRRAGDGDLGHRQGREPACWCRPPTACASRRTAASRSSSSKHGFDNTEKAALRPPFLWLKGRTVGQTTANKRLKCHDRRSMMLFSWARLLTPKKREYHMIKKALVAAAALIAPASDIAGPVPAISRFLRRRRGRRELDVQHGVATPFGASGRSTRQPAGPPAA